MTGLATPDSLEDPVFGPACVLWREGRFGVQRCASCGELQWPPRPICGGCRSFDFSWQELPTAARVYSWTTVRREVDSRPESAVVLGELVAHPRIRVLAALVDDGEAGALRLNAPLSMDFAADGTGFVRPQWKLEPAAESVSPAAIDTDCRPF